VGVYRFYRFRSALPRAIVIRSDSLLPSTLAAQDWELTRDRTPDDTNADVRDEVDEHGYCLIENECSFEQLARELQSVTVPASGPPATAPEPQSADEYHFYVHRSLKAWRMAFRSREHVAALTRLDDWRFSRARSAAETSPAVRKEIADRGYCLFKIGGDLAHLEPMA
jgi:hypothetical protein